MELKDIPIGEWHFRQHPKEPFYHSTYQFIKDTKDIVYVYRDSAFDNENLLDEISEKHYDYYNEIFKTWTQVNQ
jgi:hypothetical protein